MFSPSIWHFARRSTTLDLEMSESTQYKVGIVVFGWLDNHVTYRCEISDRVRAWHLPSGHVFVWDLEGNTLSWCHGLLDAPLLAYRPMDGAWKVIDSSVSALLPKIDAEIEDGA
jgi:hypothetical protein